MHGLSTDSGGSGMMNNDRNGVIRALVLCALVLFSFVGSNFAEAVTFTYDKLNRLTVLNPLFAARIFMRIPLVRNAKMKT